MSYDPAEFGARCDVCPLRECRAGAPVPGEVAPGAKWALVGEAPGADEVKHGRPFVGRSGQMLDQTLMQAGLPRGGGAILNAVACRPPDNKMSRVLSKVQADNRKIRAENLRRKKEAEKRGQKSGVALLDEVMTPLECCAPRLAHDLFVGTGTLDDPKPFDRLMIAGNVPAKVLLGREGIMDLRGGLMEGWLWLRADGTPRIFAEEPGHPAPKPADIAVRIKAMPILHPAFVLRSPKWTRTFKTDIARARRWFGGHLEWSPPTVHWHPTAAQLDDFLRQIHARSGILTFDLETDGIDERTAKIRCVGIGDGQDVAIVGFLGVDGARRFYTLDEEERVRDVLAKWLTDPDVLKAGHNAGRYDRLVLEFQWGVTPKPLADTLLLHRLTESELPHNLGFVASLYTDVPAWKSDREGKKKAWGSETDEELHEYCAIDVAVTQRVQAPLYTSVVARKQDHLIAFDHAIQSVCTEMTSMGMFVNQKRRAEHEKAQIHRMIQARKALRAIAGRNDFNPGSTTQLRDLLFDRWKWERYFPRFAVDNPKALKGFYNDAGDPSTNDDVLRAMMTIDELSPHEGPCEKGCTCQVAFLRALRDFRKASKLLGTYITKLRFQNEIVEAAIEGFDEDEDKEEREERQRRGELRRGICDPKTGRIYPGYNSGVAVTGRLSSSRPINAQNFPTIIKDMICASPGHVLVGADADQLELRFGAALWGLELYLEVFAAPIPVTVRGVTRLISDPHSVTAGMVFAADYWDCPDLDFDERGQFSGGKESKKLRDLGKRICYASLYKALPPTVHRVITETEDKKGNLPYARLPLAETVKNHAKWIEGANAGNPGIEKGWERELTEFRRQGYLMDPVGHRRRDFLDASGEGSADNEIVNFKVQCGGARLMMEALLETREQLPPNAFGLHTGIITQTHDSMTLEVPPEKAEWARKLLETTMRKEHAALPRMVFSAKGDHCCATWDEKQKKGEAGPGTCPHTWDLT